MCEVSAGPALCLWDKKRDEMLRTREEANHLTKGQKGENHAKEHQRNVKVKVRLKRRTDSDFSRRNRR